MHRFLGKSGLSGSVRVYLAGDCLEIEEQRPVDIVRHRVFLDDVLMVTRCKRLGWIFLTVAGLFAGLFGLTATIMFILGLPLAGAIFGAIALALAVAFVVRIMIKMDVITVQGRRRHVEIAFGMDKAEVKATFDDIVAAVREKIEETNARLARERPVEVVPDVGPPPEWAPVPKPAAEAIDVDADISEAMKEFQATVAPPAQAPELPTPTKPPPAPKPVEEELPPFMPAWRPPPQPRKLDSPDAWLPPKKSDNDNP
ncbi:MAG TPA: hypothetical protein VKX17_17535 [Planctomycetota bacterium]|nr:hypothetical protein [Planctomycetota bacterium]